MSKHHHDECCYPSMYGYGMGGYGGGYAGGAVAGYGGGAVAGYGCGGGIRWIYALLILIVIVLQFGRRKRECNVVTNPCDDGAVVGTGFGKDCNESLIDNSVLFIIVVFLLILCAGCFGGGSCGSGYGGGYGY